MAKKRGQNEGSIYKRADGRWEGALTLPNSGGKRKRFYGETQREAREKMTAALRALDQGEAPITDRQTVAQFLARWLEDSVKPSKAPKTYASYADLVRLHIVPTLGKHQLSKLQPQHVEALMAAKTAAGLSPRTVQYIRAVLRIALNRALKWGLVARNVAALTDPPRGKRPEVQPLSPAQARVFLDAARGDRLEALYSVALALGLRQGEALGLHWADVDLDAGTIAVRCQLQRIDGKPQIVPLKTGKSRRTIDMPASTVAGLRAHRTRQLSERLLAGERWQDRGLVFTTVIGTPLDPGNVRKRFQLLLNGAGLPHQRFHDLRHTCASLLLAQNVHPRIVMEILGHSQIAMTMDTYSHVMPTMRREAAGLLDTLLTGS